jgi:putative ABC transport system permease protein
MTVIAAAGLLIRSVLELQSADLGLPTDRLILLDLHVPHAKWADRHRHAQLLDNVVAQLAAIPAASAATPVNVPPFSSRGWDVAQFTAEGQTTEQTLANPSLNLDSIHPNYFETFGIPIVRGRAFSGADREGSVQVAIISQDLAARVWSAGDALGKRLKMGRPEFQSSWYTIVGIAAQTRYREVTGPRPTLYLPAAQFQMSATSVVLRTAAPADQLVELARDRIRRVDPDVQLVRIVPFKDMLERPLARPRFNAFLLSVFGSAALLLSMVGLYSVMASYVRQRRIEIAVRLALGATVGRVRNLVMAPQSVWQEPSSPAACSAACSTRSIRWIP